jgi:hypothetical protein
MGSNRSIATTELGVNPRPYQVGGLWKRRHPSKPATRHCPTRLRGATNAMVVPTATVMLPLLYRALYNYRMATIPQNRLSPRNTLLG